MRPTFLWLCVLALATAALAQLPDTAWWRTLGGGGNDIGYSVAEALDEGFVVAGHTSSYGIITGDALLIRLSVTGDTLWRKTFGGAYHQEIQRLRACDDGGFIGVGLTRPDDTDMWIVRTDEQGDSLWALSLGILGKGDGGHDIIPIPGGDWLAVGYSFSYGVTPGMFVARVTNFGDTVWTRSVGGIGQDHAYASALAPDGCFLVVGWTSPVTERVPNVYVVKVAPDGDTVWTREFATDDVAEARDVVALGDSGFMLAGWVRTADGDQAFLMRLGPDGDSMWTKTFGDSGGDDLAYAFARIEDGGYYVAGTRCRPVGGYCDAWVFSTDHLGNQTGQFCWHGHERHDYFYDVIACSDGGWMATGTVDTWPRVPNLIAAKSVPTGNLIRNGDFSYWRDRSRPFGWIAEDSTKASVKWCSDTAYSAPWSARLTRLVSGAGENFGVRRLIVVEDGEDYTLTAWMLDQSEDADGGIGISWYDADTDYISSSATVYADSGVAGWQGISVTDQAPESAAFADVRVRVYGHSGSQPGGTIYVDNVALTKGLTGSAERKPSSRRREDTVARFARDVLRLSGRQEADLLDVSGRRVMELRPGENDLQLVSPGVYFVRRQADGMTVKVVVQR